MGGFALFNASPFLMVQLLKKVETLQLLVVMANRTGAAKVAEELM